MISDGAKKKTIAEWVDIFQHAKHGHILWDGWAKDPHNPVHAYNSSHLFIQHAESLGFFRTGNCVLDLGCGNGRLGIALSERDISYYGIDPLDKCIDFCQWAFKDYPNMKFLFTDIYNQCFNPNGLIKPEDFRIPFANEFFGDIVAYSVFTHLETLESAQNYMMEIKRVLKPGGKLFTTWYRSPPNERTTFVGRTCYHEWDIMSMMTGFSFEYTYGGHTDQYYDQWAIFSTKLG